MTVVTKQGDLELLNDPLAQELLQSRIHARLSYMWPDGTPRVVPINFHWTGEELVLGTPPRAPKVMALQQNPKVAITIDTDDFPHKVLLIRGTSTLDVMDRVVSESA
jgi:nitroimidazol reductase NimA-like FMN-containing flavoprotein (pyridoxamine 5'-phosphate oxidase superfamily)